MLVRVLVHEALQYPGSHLTVVIGCDVMQDCVGGMHAGEHNGYMWGSGWEVADQNALC